MREQALAVFRLYVGHGLEKLPKQEFVTPLNRVLGIGAVAGALFVSEQFRIALVGRNPVLAGASGFKLDEPIAQSILSTLHCVFFKAVGDQSVDRQNAVA